MTPERILEICDNVQIKARIRLPAADLVEIGTAIAREAQRDALRDALDEVRRETDDGEIHAIAAIRALIDREAGEFDAACKAISKFIKPQTDGAIRLCVAIEELGKALTRVTEERNKCASEARREALELVAREFPDDSRYYKNVGAFVRALKEGV